MIGLGEVRFKKTDFIMLGIIEHMKLGKEPQVAIDHELHILEWRLQLLRKVRLG